MSTTSQSTTEPTTPEQIAKGLFPHQIEGVAFLLRRSRAILANVGELPDVIRAA